MIPLPKLMVAPNGARKTKADHPGLPLTLTEIVQTAVACHDAGADGLHLHLRDKAGGHILDAGSYLQALAALRLAVPGMALQITTEAVGKYLPAQQRDIVEAVRPEAVSISLAEMSAEGDLSKLAGFYARCLEHDIAVQHILYGPDDLDLMSSMLNDGHLALENLQLMFVLGRYSHDQQSSPDDLEPYSHWIDAAGGQIDWAACAFGKRETECLTAAYELGGKIRVGFENSFWNADGSRAMTNAERVRDVCESIRQSEVNNQRQF